MNVWDIYEDLTNLTAVRTYIENQMEEYNASSGVVRMNLVLFHDAIEHICRIVRVISQVSNDSYKSRIIKLVKLIRKMH